ncbi:MAG: hypothetical protein ABSG82_02025 [Sedimentisphaerales bacterium]|jgi:hypothetical protein
MFKRVILTTLAIITILALCVFALMQRAKKGEPSSATTAPPLPLQRLDALLGTIPADVIFCVGINNLNQTTGNLDQYLMGLGPMPVSSAGLIKGWLGMAFGNTELKGFDVNGSFAAFATVESGQTEPNFYVLLPVADYNQIIDPNFRVSQPDANGISTVGGGPAGQFFIRKVQSFVMVSYDYRKLNDMADSISGAKTAGLTLSLDAVQVKQASSEPVWAYANMVKISSVYKTQISDGIEEMRKHLADPAMAIQSQIDNLEKTKKQMASADPNSPMIARFDAQIESLKAQQAQVQKSPAFMAGLANAFAGYAKDFMQQSKSVTLTCNPKPAVLNLGVGLNALPGTEMAGMFVAEDTAKNNPLLGYTEDGAAMNLVGRMNHSAFKKINAKSIDLFAQMAGKDANDPNIVKTRKLCDDYTDSIGDFIACSFRVDPNAKPFFDAKYVLEVNDVNRFNKTKDEFIRTWAGSAFNDLYKSMGVECNFMVKRGVDKYKDVSIDVATLGIKFTDTNSPQSKMLGEMYGSGFEYRWAIVNGLWMCRVSSDPNAIYKLIDQVKAGPPAQVCSEMQKAMSIIPEASSRDAIVTYNYLRLMKMMQTFAPAPFTMPDVPSRSNLVLAAKIDNGSLAIDFALPKEHLSEMMTAFQMMMQQQTRQQPVQVPAGMPSQPVPPADINSAK